MRNDLCEPRFSQERKPVAFYRLLEKGVCFGPCHVVWVVSPTLDGQWKVGDATIRIRFQKSIFDDGVSNRLVVLVTVHIKQGLGFFE